MVTYTEQQARDQLAAPQLEGRDQAGRTAEEETKGTITAQNPIAGMMVDVATTVRLTLNEGPETAVIPANLVGKDVDDVENDLQELDFSNVDAVAAKSENPDTKPNEVLRISPREGATVALDAKITVTYATGKSEVPNFDGLPRQRAIEVADEAGFDEPDLQGGDQRRTGGDGDRAKSESWAECRPGHQDHLDPGRGPTAHPLTYAHRPARPRRRRPPPKVD